jgi:hypothetical protein
MRCICPGLDSAREAAETPQPATVEQWKRIARAQPREAGARAFDSWARRTHRLDRYVTANEDIQGARN